MLIKISNDDQQNIPDCIKNIIDDVGSVTNISPRCTLELRDLDSMTTLEEVKASVCAVLGDHTQVKVSITGPNTRQQKMAFVELVEETQATKLLEAKTIKVGWIYSRIRRLVTVKRCFRCFGYGHMQHQCEGPDRRSANICNKCGKSGHHRTECISKANCFLCIEKEESAAHAPGSGKCLVFRKALEKAREAQVRNP